MNKTEQKLYLDALAYNLKRLYNIQQKNKAPYISAKEHPK